VGRKGSRAFAFVAGITICVRDATSRKGDYAIYRKIRFGGVGMAVAALFFSISAWAQSFPNRPVTLIIPFPPGGQTDITGRIIARAMAEKLDQPVVVENVGGAGGVVGMNKLMRSPKDGYTIGIANRPLLVFRPTMYPDFPVTAGKSYTPLALMTELPLVFVTCPESDIKSVQDIVASAKKTPGAVSYGSPGIATAGHLSIELRQQMEGIRLNHIPYQGEGPAMIDVMGGRVELAALGSNVKENVDAGKMRAIATAGKARWKLFPDTPTVEEAGVPGYSFTSWVGIVAPAGLPPATADKLSNVLGEVVAQPDARDALEALGMVVNPQLKDEFEKYIQDDVASWEHVLKTSGLKIN